LERTLERFVNAWQRGERPALEDYLAGFQAERRALLIELVHEDLECRLQAGEPARVESYTERFPELRGDRAVVLSLITAEYAIRGPREPNCSGAEYQQRFPEYAETLADRLRRPADRSLTPQPRASDTAEMVLPRLQPKAPDTPRPVPVDDAAPESQPGGMAIPGYQILGELGRGGMGVVFRARQTSLGRVVALKMVLDGRHAGSDERARFRREAEDVARLQHPHIVQIHEVGEHDGTPFFSLEYVEAGNLDKRINGTPLPARVAVDLVEKLARAVDAAHQKGIVHRDLKPANVLLTADGQPKITDFGLAKRVEREAQSAEGAEHVAARPAVGALTQSGAIVGTPSYMAPEQAGGPRQTIGPAADVYALGAILYECLTGRPPFRGETALDTVRQVRSEEPVPPSRLNRKVPRDLETISLKCLAKVPGKRYPTAEDLAEDLRRFRAGEPIRARPAGRLEKAWRWCRRKPALAGMVAAVSLLVVGLVAGAFWYLQDQADRSVQAAQAEQKQMLAEQGIGQALDQAEAVRAELLRKLRQRGGVFELLNHPEDWQARINMTQAGLDRARALLDNTDERVNQVLKGRADQMKLLLERDEADRLLAMSLEKVRTDRSAVVGRNFDYKKAAKEYPRLFAAAHLEVTQGNRETVVRRILSMPIKEQVVAALDDWAYVAFVLGNKTLPEKLLVVARAAAHDPAWGNRLRQPKVWRNPRLLAALAKEAPATGLSPQLLALLGNLLPEKNGLSQMWLREAQARFP
jgi:serine/threonine-protein kinase